MEGDRRQKKRDLGILTLKNKSGRHSDGRRIPMVEISIVLDRSSRPGSSNQGQSRILSLTGLVPFYRSTLPSQRGTEPRGMQGPRLEKSAIGLQCLWGKEKKDSPLVDADRWKLQREA